MSTRSQHRPERRVLAIATLGTMLAPLNSTMIVVALPSMLKSFNLSLTWGSWVVISYLVAMAAFQPLGGSLGDRYGRRRLFLLGLTGFFAASVLGALSWRIEILVAARTAQAITGALTIPNGTALVRSHIRSDRQGRAFGFIGAAVAIAAGLGPPVGGLLTETLGWRWIFAANLLLIVPALVFGVRLPTAHRRSRLGRFDLWGACLLTCALTSLALALTVWRIESMPLVGAPVFGSVAVLCAFVLIRHVRRMDQPIMDLSLFHRPGFLAASSTVLLSNMVMYTILLSMPVFLFEQVSWNSGRIGLLLAGLSLQMLIFSPIGGYLADRVGKRAPAMAGATLIAAGALPLLFIDNNWQWTFYLLPLVAVGVGIGLVSAPIQTAAVQAAPVRETGQAAGLFSTMRYLGSILGAAGMAAILTGTKPAIAEFQLLYLGLFLAACGAIFAAQRLPSAQRRQRPTLEPHAASVPAPLSDQVENIQRD